MSDQHQTPEPEWYRMYPAPSEPDPQDEHGALADAAAHMRDAAEYMRDAATPPKERRWDFSWFTNWVKYRPTGKAFKHAAYSSGPAFAVLLWYYAHSSGTSAGAAAFFFALLISIAHLFIRNAFSRWLLWGSLLAPVYYFPALASIVFGIVEFLFGVMRK